jgi:hypothetical protein
VCSKPSVKAGPGNELEGRMKNLFSIGYDLDKPGQDYHKLIVELKNLGAKRALMSQWMLDTDSTAKELRDHLAKFMDPNDRLLVIDVATWSGRRAMFDINTL